MKANNIDVNIIIAQAKTALDKEKDLSASFRAIIQLLLVVVEILVGKLSKNSKNSSIPPSQDPNRAKQKQAATSKKPGGQPGRTGVTLQRFENPDEIIAVPVDRNTLPANLKLRHAGTIKRQVVEISIQRRVIEYHLEILKDQSGKRYQAEAPRGVNSTIQYGNSVKALAVYMNNYQLLPYARLENYFIDQAQIPISPGSLCNFNQEAYQLLAHFEALAKAQLIAASVLHTDETGININGKKQWLHTASSAQWVLLTPHAKRGKVAMEEIGILPKFQGVMVHDHWRSYFTYAGCRHAVCNAHHLRELQAVIEFAPDHVWAKRTQELLLEIRDAVAASGGIMEAEEQESYRLRYRALMEQGLAENPLAEPPPPEIGPDGKKKQKKRGKKTKERNLLERLAKHEAEVLRFMTDKQVPFTNNQGERDLRMAKVQQKISGCFKTLDTAAIHCRIRSYLLTAARHDISPTAALTQLFQGKLPAFCDL